MKDGPNIAIVAALIGDPARSNMLCALVDGRALTASELAIEAGVTKQTASAHLTRLVEANLLAREIQGRHHYFRLAGAETAHALEALMGLAAATGRRTHTGPRDPALRKARVCYDHLAGEMGVELFQSFRARRWLKDEGGSLRVTPLGWRSLDTIGVAPDDLPASRRPDCKACLDWSARKHHLAGRVGRAVLDRMLALGWANCARGSRVLTFSSSGERSFANWIK